jgi:putative PIG3 family NAD(P)H quinone oxidoreductase
MKAVIVENKENMKIDTVPKITLRSPLDVLIKVKATGVNRADVLQRKGLYNAPLDASQILGLEVSGIVEEVGAEVTKFAVGDNVMALVDGGGYAEYCVAFQTQVMPLPLDYTFEQGACIPESFLTAFQNIFLIGEIKNNSKILVHAGASGVGVASIQLCKFLENVDVYVTVGSQEKAEFCSKLGAISLNYNEGDWFVNLKDKVAGVDIVFDCIAQNYFSRNLEILNVGGRLLMIGSLSGWVIKGNDVDLQPIVRKRLRIEGSTLRARCSEYKSNLVTELMKYTEGRWQHIQPLISKVFDWTEVNEAHRFMEDNKNIGKIIMTGM